MQAKPQIFFKYWKGIKTFEAQGLLGERRRDILPKNEKKREGWSSFTTRYFDL